MEIESPPDSDSELGSNKRRSQRRSSSRRHSLRHGDDGEITTMAVETAVARAHDRPTPQADVANRGSTIEHRADDAVAPLTQAALHAFAGRKAGAEASRDPHASAAFPSTSVTGSSIVRSARTGSSAVVDEDAVQRIRHVLEGRSTTSAASTQHGGSSKAHVPRSNRPSETVNDLARKPLREWGRMQADAVSTSERFRREMIDNLRRAKAEQTERRLRSTELERLFRREARAMRDHADNKKHIDPTVTDAAHSPSHESLPFAPNDDGEWWRGIPALEVHLLSQQDVTAFFSVPAFLRPLDRCAALPARGATSDDDGAIEWGRAEAAQRHQWEASSYAAFEAAKRNVALRLR